MVTTYISKFFPWSDTWRLWGEGWCCQAGLQWESRSIWKLPCCAHCFTEASLVVDDEHGMGWIGRDKGLWWSHHVHWRGSLSSSKCLSDNSVPHQNQRWKVPILCCCKHCSTGCKIKRRAIQPHGCRESRECGLHIQSLSLATNSWPSNSFLYVWWIQLGYHNVGYDLSYFWRCNVHATWPSHQCNTFWQMWSPCRISEGVRTSWMQRQWVAPSGCQWFGQGAQHPSWLACHQVWNQRL